MEYIIGIIVALFVQFLKRVWGTNVLGTYLTVLLVSFAAAALYVTYADTAIWATMVQIATVAGAFYAYVIRRFENFNSEFDLEEVE